MVVGNWSGLHVNSYSVSIQSVQGAQTEQCVDCVGGFCVIRVNISMCHDMPMMQLSLSDCGIGLR